MSLRPLATALIMAFIAAPAHAELIIDRQDGQSPTVVSDAAISRSLSAPASSGVPSNLHFSDTPQQAPASAHGAMSYRAVDPARVVVPQAHDMRGQVIESRRLAASSPASPRVFETGTARPANADAPVKGWADDVPLELAMQQVVPHGWSVTASPGVRQQLSAPVSWSGDRPWVSVLSSMISRHPISARVDWDARQVLLFDSNDPIPSSLVVPGAVVVKGTAPTAASVPSFAQAPVRQAHHQAPVLAQPAPIQSTQSIGVAQVPCCAPASVATVVQAPQTSHRWLIDPRLTLRENVEAWTRQAGWNSVVWEAADYEMVAPAQFEGNFASPEGPLARLIQAYAESDQPLKVRLLTQDKVVHVSNRNYTPTVVDPATPRSITPSTFSH